MPEAFKRTENKKTINVTNKVKKIFIDSKVLYQALKKKQLSESEFLEIILRFFWEKELKSSSFILQDYVWF